MADIQVMVLGAGQEVGRSCVVIAVDDTYIMLDCGMHLAYRDVRRFPDFSLLPFRERLTEMLGAILITHFHLDHCGALPYLVETCGYQGPIYMTHPTKAIMPVMLTDYHKVMTERLGDREWFTPAGITAAVNLAVGLDLNSEAQILPGVTVTALYAGHVLGAAQFHLNIHGRTVLYTGDYNTSADRHLGAASLPRLRPHLLISESTYATTLRDSKKSRERDLVTEVLHTVSAGGKVLIPVFAVGRAQELLILLEDAWRRAGLLGRVPLYHYSAMGSRANALYRAHVNWASQQLRTGPARHGAFTFQHVQAWTRELIHAPGPCVLFASPGMLNGGMSLEVFKAWAPQPGNLVVLPGYQAAGTIGGKLMSGQLRELQLGSSTVLVQCKVRYLSFSAHTDAAGILQLITASGPRAVMLVHGDTEGMQFMASRINRLLGVPVKYPPNGGQWVSVPVKALPVPVQVSATALLPASAHGTDHRRPRAAGTAQLPVPQSTYLVSGLMIGRVEAGAAVDMQVLSAADAAESISATGQHLTVDGSQVPTVQVQWDPVSVDTLPGDEPTGGR